MLVICYLLLLYLSTTLYRPVPETSVCHLVRGATNIGDHCSNWKKIVTVYVLHSTTTLSTVSNDTNTSGTLSRSCGPWGTMLRVVPLDHVREPCCVSRLSLPLKGELLGSICWMWCMVALTNISAAMHLCKRQPPPPPHAASLAIWTTAQTLSETPKRIKINRRVHVHWY